MRGKARVDYRANKVARGRGGRSDHGQDAGRAQNLLRAGRRLHSIHFGRREFGCTHREKCCISCEVAYPSPSLGHSCILIVSSLTGFVNAFVLYIVMPVVSKKQFAAMQAAAHGKSTIGIPKKVAKEFISATPKGAYKSLPNRVRNNHKIGR